MSKIEWPDKTINPIIGCSKISEGCVNCYAEKFAWRMAHNPKLSDEVRKAYQSVVSNGKWNGKTAFVPSAFDVLKTWKKPIRIFVGSMGDIFHESVGENIYRTLFRILNVYWQHTFIFLSKRVDKMADILPISATDGDRLNYDHIRCYPYWLGVTVESQNYISRIDDLLKIPTKVRFVSVEPMLSEVVIPQEKLRQLQWVICGNEKTQNGSARYNAEENIISLSNQCAEAGVPFFFKSWGTGHATEKIITPDGLDWVHLIKLRNAKEDGILRREFPK